MAEIACFLALLMGLRSHKTCNQGNNYMEMCRTNLFTPSWNKLHILMHNIVQNNIVH